MRPPAPPADAGVLARTTALLTCVVGLACFAGCASLPRQATELVANTARPLLALDPNAVWTDAYNRLVELGPAGLAYLMEQPEMMQPAAPDALRVLVHTSLVSLLADPRSAPPRLTACCLETTLGLLHFDLKVAGKRLGPVVLPQGRAPRAWHELYPADFDHTLAAAIDLEADRRALRAWWAAGRNNPEALVTRQRLQPVDDYLWPLLGRRRADRWEYLPEPRAVLCASPEQVAMLELATVDYNLVRAACVWLGSRPDAQVQARLIELLASTSPVVADNARLALEYSADERVRAVLRRYPRRN